MALAFLLDEHITYVVAREIQVKRPDIHIVSARTWRDGALRGKPDEWLLRAAAEDGLSLVTYDQKTIPPLLTEWGVTGEDHAGFVFVDEKSIREGDIGGTVNALIQFWDRSHAWEWKNAVDFLRPVGRG